MTKRDTDYYCTPPAIIRPPLWIHPSLSLLVCCSVSDSVIFFLWPTPSFLKPPSPRIEIKQKRWTAIKILSKLGVWRLFQYSLSQNKNNCLLSCLPLYVFYILHSYSGHLTSLGNVKDTKTATCDPELFACTTMKHDNID